MAELCAERAERPAEGFAEGAWAHASGRKAAAHETRGALTFAVTPAPAATPIADMVEAMLSSGIPVEGVVLAARTAELARGGNDPVAVRRHAFDREPILRALAKAPPAEPVAKPPVVRAFGPIVTALNKIMSVQS